MTAELQDRMNHLIAWCRTPQMIQGTRVDLTLAADLIEEFARQQAVDDLDANRRLFEACKRADQIVDDFHATALGYREQEKELEGVRVALNGYKDSDLASLAAVMANRLDILEFQDEQQRAEDANMADIQEMFRTGRVIGENQCMSKDGTDQD